MYGVKRGIKAPGDFGITDMAGLAFSGAVGIIAALVADYQQKGEAAALFKINEWVVQFGSLLGFTDIPLWMVVVGMTVVGAGSVFYFQPITRQGAFAQGFGLLAVLLTMTPPNLASGIQGINDNLPGLEPALAREASLGARVINAAYKTETAKTETVRLQQVQQRRQAAKYDVHLRIVFPDGITGEMSTMIRRGTIRGRLHNEDTDETFNLFRTTDGATIRSEGNTLIFHAGVPARAEQARLWVRIETVGYAIEQQSALADLSEPLEWTVTMKKSTVPLFVQRLGQSYWF